MFREVVAYKPVAYKNKCTKLEKTHFAIGEKISTECGQLVGMFWRQTLGD